MQTEVSLPRSQEVATGPCPEPHETHFTSPDYVPCFHFNIILPLTPTSSELVSSFQAVQPKFCMDVSLHAAFPASFILYDMISLISDE
jgi:hypothetical protein